MLGHLAADQGAARLAAAIGDACDHFGHGLALQLADSDVVQEEQGLCTGCQDVVYAHGNQVHAHGAMLAGDLGNLQLGSHAVGAGNQQRVFHILCRGDAEQAAEPADVAHYLIAVGGMHGVLDGMHGTGALGSIHASLGVRDLLFRRGIGSGVITFCHVDTPYARGNASAKPIVKDWGHRDKCAGAHARNRGNAGAPS